MNGFDLESKLKSARVPERPDEYWDDFPLRIRVQMRRERREFAPQSPWHPRFAWAGGFALALALVFACIQFRPLEAVSLTITKQHQQFHAQLARLEVGLHKLVLNVDGMGYLLAETN